jgi:arginyl-tRNA synthetase
VITRDLRRALARAVAAAGFEAAAEPGLRPTGTPGQYAASVALALGASPAETAAALAAGLRAERWIASAEVTGPGYLTVTVTPESLAAVADVVTAAGPACVTSDALAGVTVPAAPPADPLAAPTWEEARAALAARLTASLAAAAGAKVADLAGTERNRLTLQAHAFSPDPSKPSTRAAPEHFTNSDAAGVSRTRSDDSKAEPTATGQPPQTAGPGGADMVAGFAIGPAGPRIGGYGGSPPRETTVAAAVSFAGRDAVTFTLARAVPGKPLGLDKEIMARRVPANPAYAVRYAHARAASGVRWAVSSRGGDLPYSPPTAGDAGVPLREATALPGPPADPGELALLDALSWLPERVATAARRGRPDEFARYLEDLASVTVDVLSSARHQGSGPKSNRAPGSDRLSLARAARTGLAAGLGLLGVAAPDRL